MIGRRLAVVRVLLFALVHASAWACSREAGRTPTGPSTSPAADVVVTRPLTNTSNAITGTVTDTANRPLHGARVEVAEGSEAGMFTLTDSNGKFSFASVDGITESTQFRATKEGHIAATTSLREHCGDCGAFRWLHFSLGSLAQPVNIDGDYTVSIIAEGRCAAIPEEVRTRTYVAAIRQNDMVGRPPGTSFNVTFTDPQMLDQYRKFSIGIAGDYVSFYLGNLDGTPSMADPGVAEQIAPNRYFSIGGSGAATVAVPVTSIIATLDGYVDYCELNSAMGSSYSCQTGVIKRTICESSGHRLILTRR
jgi:hypothetical protein